MTEELREQIAGKVSVIYMKGIRDEAISCPETAVEFLSLFTQAGWKSPEEVQTIIQMGYGKAGKEEDGLYGPIAQREHRQEKRGGKDETNKGTTARG